MPPEPTPRTRRRARAWVVTMVALLVLAYVAVVVLYAVADNQANIAGSGCPDDAPSDAVLISFTPQSVDAAGDRLVSNFAVLSFGPLAKKETGFLVDPLTVLVSDNDGPRSFTVAADAIPSPQPLRLITDGFIEQWPFDTHAVDVVFVSLQTVGADTTPVDTIVCGAAHVPGWTFSSEQVEGSGDIVINGEPVPELRIVASRSPASVAFGLLILALMVVMPVLSLTVAILAYRGVRKVEATLMSWMAAMLFATIPLRTFLPGSPPIGSWVDYLVVLWVLAGLVLALVIYVRAWVRWTPAAAGYAPGDSGAVAVGVAAASAPLMAVNDASSDADAGADGGSAGGSD